MTNKARYYLKEGFIQLFITPNQENSRYVIRAVTLGVDHQAAINELTQDEGVTSFEAELYGIKYRDEVDFRLKSNQWFEERLADANNMKYLSLATDKA